ncbi:hypothetical protein CG51_05310 [Haematobacter missouriensis]|uniref:Uncharacterized protein n=1 Tax=Haematobacter missouriensis TaxID=366616 RepID=A0A212AI52_9RHOB|nr:hypothetical protein [Haematobacter missouriensis]KFI34297.1 hypothetical protein CG51_05310 [Haematobacter missouriensis]OWJ72403.1 hypothetical protein CDV53_17555 [Haematobacter missouriensis]OWJ81093.1 hypothetical protein CDV52_19630 [Haematobacter missouriensis]
MSSDQIAREFTQATGGDLHAAIFRMAAVIDLARCRAEDAMPRAQMDGHQLELLWRDLNPHRLR